SVGRYRLVGEALEPPVECVSVPQIDRFEDVRAAEDVLLIVDDHRSMEPLRERVLAEASTLLPVLADSGRDWRLAVTTTGLGGDCAGGTLLGDPPILDASSNAPDAWLAAALDVATCEASSGRGIHAAVEALEAERGFRRPLAGL